jgi:hypothetical protein
MHKSCLQDILPFTVKFGNADPVASSFKVPQTVEVDKLSHIRNLEGYILQIFQQMVIPAVDVIGN